MTAPSQQTILVTGANGFVASHIVKHLLEKGYNVRGAVRSEASANKLKAALPQYESRLSFAIVKDMTDPAAYDGKLDGVTGILHTASPFVLNVRDNLKELLEPARDGAVAILEAAAKVPTVTHVVNTSSCASVCDVSKGARPGYNYTEADWNPMTWDEAAVTPNGTLAYCASKAHAERAMWNWMKEHEGKVSFGFTSINPSWVLGPHAQPLTSLSHLNESSQLMWGMVDATEIPGFDFGGYNDVRDLAMAQVLCLEKPELSKGERFIFSRPFRYQMAADIMREHFPELRNRVPEGEPGYVLPAYNFDGSKIARVLGFEYRPLSETVHDAMAQMLEVEKVAA